MYYIRIVFTFVIVFTVFSCNNSGDDKSTKKDVSVSVDVIIASEEDFPLSVEVNGTVLSEDMIELHPEVSGRITYLNIPDGATVQAGTVLLKINDSDLQAELENLQTKLELANKTEERLKKLLAVNGISQETYDIALNEVNSLEASIKEKNAQIDKTVIRAAFTGKLGLRLVSLGAYVTPLTLVSTLQTDKVKIDFTVPETYDTLVAVGKKVLIQTTNSETMMNATISAVEPQINTETRNIKVRAHLDSGSVTAGSFVKVYLKEEGKGIVVPTNAIIPDAQSNQVIVVKKGKGVFTNVETGLKTADLVEISSGLEIGDSIVVSGILFVRPNAKVKISKVKKLGEK